MNVKEIVIKYLSENGYDGLSDGMGCGCVIADLMPDEGCGPDCEAGYEEPCNCGEKCDFHIAERKEEDKL